MTSLVDRFFRENISLSPQHEIFYGTGEAYVSYPCRFATADFELCAGYGLELIVDRMRKDLGFKPLEPIDGDDDCAHGEYVFYVGLNDYTKIDNCISAFLLGSDSPDNETIYPIDLTEEEQDALYRRLDEEARRAYGMSCEDIMVKARQFVID